MPSPPDAETRCRLFVAEHTGLSADTIMAVLLACRRFWLSQYPDLFEATVDRVAEVNAGLDEERDMKPRCPRCGATERA